MYKMMAMADTQLMTLKSPSLQSKKAPEPPHLKPSNKVTKTGI